MYAEVGQMASLKIDRNSNEADYALAAWLKHISKTAVMRERSCASNASGLIYKHNNLGAWERPKIAISTKSSRSNCPVCTGWKQDGHKHMTKQRLNPSKTRWADIGGSTINLQGFPLGGFFI